MFDNKVGHQAIAAISRRAIELDGMLPLCDGLQGRKSVALVEAVYRSRAPTGRKPRAVNGVPPLDKLLSGEDSLCRVAAVGLRIFSARLQVKRLRRSHVAQS